MMKATVIGATGLIGGLILDELQKRDEFSSVTALSRREVEFSQSKVSTVLVDFELETDLKKAMDGSDVIFCAIGTTNKKVDGDKSAYRQVDFDIPVRAGKICKENHISKFLIVSSVGADSSGTNFYIRLKGETEDALSALDLPYLGIFRPSMLLGHRQEFRLGESIGQFIMKVFKFLIPHKYKPISAKNVAKAMVAASIQSNSGSHIYHYREMQELLQNS